MFYDSSQFKVLEAGAQLSWLQQQLSTQNIANIETPGFKSKSLSFSGVLNEVQNAAGSPQVGQINATVSSNDEDLSQPNGNNVDLEKESILLYKSYAQYSMLLNQINTEFDKYGYVLGCNM